MTFPPLVDGTTSPGSCSGNEACFARSSARLPRPSSANLRGLRMMLNTRYYVAAPGVPKPYPEFRTLDPGRDASVQEDPLALPRAYVVGETQRMGYSAAIAGLGAGRVAPKRTAVVPPDAPRTSVSGGDRPALAREVGPGEVRVDVPPGPAGWLVVSNAYSPLWKATVDGHAQRLYPTNIASLGLPLTRGAHHVDIHISRGNFFLGLVLSLVSLAGLLALVLFDRVRL